MTMISEQDIKDWRDACGGEPILSGDSVGDEDIYENIFNDEALRRFTQRVASRCAELAIYRPQAAAQAIAEEFGVTIKVQVK
jgi:hypothetical protein